jgi:MerR family mercuric resistance operon transcriptional regulator
MSIDMTIGKLAEAAGVNVETIRYYQRRGLLEEPAKPLYGQRRYSLEQAKRVRFIKRAQALGFTLAEVGQLLVLNEARSCKTTRALAAHKLEMIEGKMADLEAVRQALGKLVRQCDAGDGAKCPIIDALADG